jgi:membrane peptidoglycan carboxypeptidase
VESSNVGATKVGLKLGPERLGRYVRRFGFGMRVCPDLPGESAGMVRTAANSDDSTVASVSIGYEIGVTPLQMAAAVAAVANGGVMIQPRVVRAKQDGGTRLEATPLELRRPITPETAATLTSIMEQVVERGTATAAAIPGFTVAGKTGTSQKLIGHHYSQTEYNASFVGFVPSRKPAFVIAVVIDSPHGGQYFGGLVAAPVFKRIAESGLRHLGIAPTLNPPSPILVNASHAAADAPSVIRPAASTSPYPPALLSSEPPSVPDVRGMAARDAALRLARVGLVARLRGNGVVNAQSPAPGQPAVRGAVCSLTLERTPLSAAQVPPSP